MKILDLDVSHLPAPEPMTKILQALAGLSPGHCLRVTHRKEPVPLYDKLGQLGFAYYTVQLSPNAFHIFIGFDNERDAVARQSIAVEAEPDR